MCQCYRQSTFRGWRTGRQTISAVSSYMCFLKICQRLSTPDGSSIAIQVQQKTGPVCVQSKGSTCGSMEPVLPNLCFYPGTTAAASFTQDPPKKVVSVILVAPAWPRRAWYSEMVKLALDGPRVLLAHPGLLSQGPTFHPALRSLNLTTWLLKPGC